MASTPSTTLQTGASGASCMLIEWRSTLILDNSVNGVKATRKLYNAMVFVFGLFGQPWRGLFSWIISVEKPKRKCFLTWVTSVKKSCTIVSFILNVATLMPDVASRLVVLRVLTLGAVDRLQEQTWVGEFQWERRTVGVHVLPPISLQHHPGPTSHTLGLPTAPGSMWGAG